MILVDSDVIIAHLRGVDAAREWLLRTRRDSGRLATSAVCIAEVAGDMRSGQRREVMGLLGSFQVIDIDESTAWQAAQLMRTYRRSHSGIGLGDYLIAATTHCHGLALATLNVRHFPMFPDLQPPFAL